MSVLSFILYVIMAMVIGLLAEKVTPFGVPGSWAGAIVVGMIGDWLGHYLFGSWGPYLLGFSLVPALIGAIIVVLVIGLIAKAFR